VDARSLTVAHFDAETEFSGGEVQVFLLIEGLARAGHRGVLFCRPGSAASERARAAGIELREIGMRNDLDARAVWVSRRELRALKPDLAHLHTGRATWLGGWAARLAGIPAITTRRMDREVSRGLRTRLVHSRLTARSVAISPSVADSLAAGGVDPARIVTIPSAVDPAHQRPRRPRQEVRDELGCGARDAVILAAGALVPRKGFDVLIEAARELADLDRTPWIWIAGDGDQHADLLQRARRAGLERILFLGRRPDMPCLLAACDIFCMPSRREGLGIAALEAMAAGRAVVASRVGGLGQAIDDGRTGLLVPPGDVRGLAAVLERLLGDSSLRTRLAAAGPEHVARNFSADRMVAEYERVYRAVLAEHARP
jgi:glycosyltransferase involved in cell wall biosynthesis